MLGSGIQVQSAITRSPPRTKRRYRTTTVAITAAEQNGTYACARVLQACSALGGLGHAANRQRSGAVFGCRSVEWYLKLHVLPVHRQHGRTRWNRRLECVVPSGLTLSRRTTAAFPSVFNTYVVGQ